MKEIIELKEIILDLPDINRTKGEKECYNILIEHIHRLSEIRKNFSKEEDDKIMKLFRNETLELFFMSDLAKYIYEKPRGYAGDFVTQEFIWNGCNDVNHRYIGINDIGKLISAFTFDMHSCLAIVSRLHFLKDEITKSGKFVASIGCGSCIEFWNSTNELPEGIDGFMLDQDSGAFDSARQHINQNGNRFNFYNDNILKFILNRDRIKLMGKRNLIYAVGLFDYFSVKNSTRIVKHLWDAVTSGGLMIITNAHPDNPTKFWMEYAGDWFLCYKNKQEMFEITEGLEDVNSIDYIIDKHNVFQYLKIRKQ